MDLGTVRRVLVSQFFMLRVTGVFWPFRVTVWVRQAVRYVGLLLKCFELENCPDWVQKGGSLFTVGEHSLCSSWIAPLLEGSIQILWWGLPKASLNKLWTGKKLCLHPDELHSNPQPFPMKNAEGFHTNSLPAQWILLTTISLSSKCSAGLSEVVICLPQSRSCSG